MNERSRGEPLMWAWVEMSPGVRTRSAASTVSSTRPSKRGPTWRMRSPSITTTPSRRSRWPSPSKAMTYPARIAMRFAMKLSPWISPSFNSALASPLAASGSARTAPSPPPGARGSRCSLSLRERPGRGWGDLHDPSVHQLVDAVDGVVLEPVRARPAAEDPADVLDGHHHRLPHQPLLDALEGLDALRLLQRGLRLLEERVGAVVLPAHGVRAGHGGGDEEVEEVGRRVDHGEEARVVLPRPRRRIEGGRLEPLDLKIATDLTELRLHGSDDALVELGEHVERGLERLAVLLPHAVAARVPARLRQEFLRSVEAELRHEGAHLLPGGGAGSERMDEAVRDVGLPLHDELDNLLPVDDVRHRSPHARVLEDLLLHVEADVVGGQPGDRRDLHALALEATDVLRRHVDVEIDAARLELGRAGCILGEGAEHDAVDPRRSRVVVGGGAPRIGIVADQLHAIVLGPFLELERPGAAYARRDDAVVLSVLGHVLGVGNARVGPFRLAHVVEEDQRRVLEPADERGVVDDLRLGETRHLGPRGKGLLGIDPAIEVVLHVLRGEGRPAVKLDALLQIEGPREPVRRGFPPVGEGGADLHLEVVKHEAVVEEHVGGDGGQAGGAPGIERVGVVVAADGEGAAALGFLLRMRSGQSRGEGSGAGRAELQNASTVEHAVHGLLR